MFDLFLQSLHCDENHTICLCLLFTSQIPAPAVDSKLSFDPSSMRLSRESICKRSLLFFTPTIHIACDYSVLLMLRCRENSNFSQALEHCSTPSGDPHVSWGCFQCSTPSGDPHVSWGCFQCSKSTAGDNDKAIQRPDSINRK